MTRPAATRPLDGIRVLDLTQIVAGPMSSFYLASLGAEVIRVERPGGDLTWKVPPFFGPRGRHTEERQQDELSLSAMKRNRGKRSVVVSLAEPDGVEIVSSLADQCDVLIENFLPGVAARLGVGWAKLSARNPRLIYCSISGYGQEGPERETRGMDFTIQAAAGLMAKTGSPEGPPNRVGFPIGDLGPATFAALGVLAALRQRDHTNRGQHIDVSMYDVLVSWLWDDPLDEYQDRGDPPRNGNRDPRGAPSNSYACSDGWVNVVVTDDRQWSDLTTILDRSDLARYDTNVARVEIASRVDEAVGDWCRVRSCQQVVSRLQAARIPVAEVVAPWDARTNAHAGARNILEPLGAGLRSETRATQEEPPTPTDRLGPRLPLHFSDTHVDTGAAEPLGASTQTILSDLLGFDETALDELKSRGIIGD